jgi:hypothetical protein
MTITVTAYAENETNRIRRVWLSAENEIVHGR